MLTQNICGKKCGIFEVAQNLVLFLYEWFCVSLKFFSLMTRQTAKSMQILFCFPLPKILSFSESSTLFPCDMLSQHIWEASTFEWTVWYISSSHVCFAALCKGILGINNISQFSFRDYNRKAFNSLHVIASLVLQLFPSNTFSLTTFLPLQVSVQFNMRFICTFKQFSIVTSIVLIIIVVVTWVFWTKRFTFSLS